MAIEAAALSEGGAAVSEGAGGAEVEGGGGIVVLGELEVNKGRCPPRSPEEILRTADEPLDPDAFDLY